MAVGGFRSVDQETSIMTIGGRGSEAADKPCCGLHFTSRETLILDDLSLLTSAYAGEANEVVLQSDAHASAERATKYYRPRK